MKRINTIYLHGGVFHADDVVCAAMVKFLYPNVNIVRVNKLPNGVSANARVGEEDYIVADIGLGVYDHHQADVPCHEDGTKFAACGRLFKDIEVELFGKKAPSTFVEQLWLIEYVDNNGPRSFEYPISTICRMSRPAWNSTLSMDDAFMEVVDVVIEHWLKPWITLGSLPFTEFSVLREKLAEAKARDKAAREAALDVIKPLITEAESNGRDFIVLSRFVPWLDAAHGSRVKYCVFPSERGGYNVSTNPCDENGSKVLLPAGWVSEKPSGCTFVHQGRFMAAFADEQSAVAAISAIS